MRYNDLTQTILAVEDRSGFGARALWRQCVDVLAQYDQPGKPVLEQQDRAALVARLHDLRGALTEAQRVASVVELGSRLHSPALIEFFASDRPAVCAAAMARARLPDALWPVLLSRLSPTARGVLRGRRDIGDLTRRALESFGATDLVLDADPAALAAAAEAALEAGTFEALDEGIAVLSVSGETISAPMEETAGDGLEHAGDVAPARDARPDILDLLDARKAADEAVRPAPLGDRGEAGKQDDASASAEAAGTDDQHSQIRQLVERIERFTSGGRQRLSGLDAHGDVPETVDAAYQATLKAFPFESDADGVLVWVGEASRPALVGLSIAQPALPGETGPDGHVAGAFARRSSFQNGRFLIGEGAYAGEWRFSATPFFDPASGRFQGYRGQARRPLIHEMPLAAAPVAPATPATQPSLDSMRQIIHELRTPLNAILGFAEIIEQQLFGPAGVHYREMAGNILVDARRLLAAFDEIDLAARSAAAEAGNGMGGKEPVAVDIEAVMDRLVGLYAEENRLAGASAPASGHPLHIAVSANLPSAYADPVQCERMIQHLTRTLVSVAGAGEAVQGAVWLQPDGEGGRLVIGFDRPSRLKGLEEQEILDPGYGRDGDWPDGPLLGLGFSLRLVRSLAQAQGGALRIEAERILLDLPVAGAMADDQSA